MIIGIFLYFMMYVITFDHLCRQTTPLQYATQRQIYLEGRKQLTRNDAIINAPKTLDDTVQAIAEVVTKIYMSMHGLAFSTGVLCTPIWQ